MRSPVRFHEGHAAWRRIQEAVKKGPAFIAVAWWGSGMSQRLRLRKGSVLVVRADPATMEQGQTSPDDLAALVSKGVRVHSVSNLHAKVFVIGRTAFVGSLNASQGSWNGELLEAAVEIAHPRAVSAARRFVAELAITPPLDLDALAALKKLYRPHPGRLRRRSARGSPRPAHANLQVLRIIRTQPADWAEHTQATFDRRAPAIRREAAS